MTKKEVYKKLAEGVEALEDAGFDIEETDITEMVSGPNDPLAQMMGLDRRDTETALVFVATFDEDGPEQEKPDDSDPDDTESVSISFDDGQEKDHIADQ